MVDTLSVSRMNSGENDTMLSQSVGNSRVIVLPELLDSPYSKFVMTSFCKLKFKFGTEP